MAENEQLKKTGRFRVRSRMKKYARKISSESSSFMTYNAPARGSVASNNNMNMYNIIKKLNKYGFFSVFSIDSRMYMCEGECTRS